ncbi:MAG: ATP-binding protein [Cyclobacteriaceae bacterium]|nr:ATP-binding protein [Cyclobacteriaceae bacterium]
MKNFRSIKGWQTFSMLAENKVKELDKVVTNKSNYNFLPTAIIYGRNASGKSNLLTAFKAFQFLVFESADFKVKDKIPAYEPYRLDGANEKEPVEFSIDFLSNEGMRYIYSIGFGEFEIEYENLIFYPKTQPATLFSRLKGKKTTYGEYLTGKKKEIEGLLYPNQLFLSKVGTEKNEQLKIPFTFFSQHMFASTIHDTQYDNALIQIFTRKMGKDDIPFFKENINKLMKVADTGIDKINIREEEMDLSNLPEDMTDDQKKELVEKYKYRIRTVHKIFDENEVSGEVEFRLTDESTGTIKLLAIGGLILEALADGQVLIIDELDKSLHPKLTKALINIFHNKKTNPKQAQLIFATHDVSLLDNELFRRDQVWFAEKEYQGCSHYYAISDIPGVRSNTPYEKWYMSGRFGATPVINELELDFQY